MSAYIAKYVLVKSGNDLREVVLMHGSYWSPALNVEFERLVSMRQFQDPMLQGWYYDNHQANLMRTTNQPYCLD
jgi:hypothetical protein